LKGAQKKRKKDLRKQTEVEKESFLLRKGSPTKGFEKREYTEYQDYQEK